MVFESKTQISRSWPQNPYGSSGVLQTLCISKKKTNSPKPFLSGKVGHTLISDLKAQWKTNGAMPSQSMRNLGILMVFASDLMRWGIHLFSPPRGQGWGFLTSSSSVDLINFLLVNLEKRIGWSNDRAASLWEFTEYECHVRRVKGGKYSTCLETRKYERITASWFNLNSQKTYKIK